MAVVNSYSLKLTAHFINILSFAKSLALLFIIVLGIWQLATAGQLESHMIYDFPALLYLSLFYILYSFSYRALK